MWSLFRKSSSGTATHDGLRFALELYRRLGHADENLVCSPWSVQSVLRLLLAGARGETAAPLGTVPEAATDSSSFSLSVEATGVVGQGPVAGGPDRRAGGADRDR